MVFIKNKWIKASSVVEMSYIMPLFFGLFLIIIQTVFFYHDKTVLAGAACETAVLGAQLERNPGTEYDLEAFFRERVNGKLIYMDQVDVSVIKENDVIEVKANSQKHIFRLSVCQKAVIVFPENKIRMMR